MTKSAAKKAGETAVIDHTYKVFPNDLNSYETVFGGLVMAILDRIALVVAERHSERTCVTASVDSMHFLGPAKKGDILLFSASINRSWKSSMEIGVKVVAESYKTREKRHILSAYFTFVALDENRKPTGVPQVIPETQDEIRRFAEAEFRREKRKQVADLLKEHRGAQQ
jgi:acyl-CoA hydrolase